MVKWKGGKKQQETALLYKQAERKSKDWSLTAKQLNRKHVTISASRGEEKEGGPDINIQGTWAQTVTGVLAIMNTFKLLWLWEEGQQLENVFTVTNFLYQSLGCQGGFTGIQLHNKVSQWGKPPTTTHKTHIIPVMLTRSMCLWPWVDHESLKILVFLCQSRNGHMLNSLPCSFMQKFVQKRQRNWKSAKFGWDCGWINKEQERL